jgi:[acyl-carrier-protein] S-malonyltransferase
MATNNGDLRSRLSDAAFAFRGYNVTNLGRTAELLAHPVYGVLVETYLRQVSELCSDTIKRPVDLVERVRAGRETRGLDEYAEDLALIVGVEIAQLRLLEEFFGVSLAEGRMAFGYSLGECSALIGTGVYGMTDLLRIPLLLADDSAELAHQVTLSLLSSRGPVLDFDSVHRLCLEISQEGNGCVDVSTYLSPNSLLLMGQNGTLGEFEWRIHVLFPKQVHVRRYQHRYPPLHTPITWQRNIPNRTAQLLQTTPGGFRGPALPVLSMVTGTASYQEFNSRELIHRWVDHPQRLWEIVYKVLADGIQAVIHVGPSPNLLPATFRRLSNNITALTTGRNLGSLGRRTLARLVRRPWLTRLLPSSAVLLRAPLVKQIILEDWLLEQTPR